MKYNQFYFACERGNLGAVERFFDTHNNIDLSDTYFENSDSVLFVACKKGHLPVVEYLLGKGADINQVNNNGETPFWIASTNGQLDIMTFLLRCIADDEHKRHYVNQPNNDGVTPLFIVYKNNRIMLPIESLDFLIENGADLNQGDNQGITPFWYACHNNHPQEQQQYLLDRGADINHARNKDSATPLWIAAYRGNLTLVQRLIEWGANALVGPSPFFIACERGQLAVAEYLFAHQPDLAENHVEGRSALEGLFANPKIDGALVLRMVRYLLELGEGIHFPSKFDLSKALNSACWHRRWNVVPLLLENGADPNVSLPDDKCTALYYASIEGRFEEVKLLIESGADVNQKGYGKSTALSGARYRGHLEIVHYLLEHGAEISLSRDGKKDLLKMACEQGDAFVVRRLFDHEVLHEENTDELVKGYMAPLWSAFDSFYKRNLEMFTLFVKGDENVHLADIDSNAPSWMDLKEIVTLLLEHGVDVDQLAYGCEPDQRGVTPLWIVFNSVYQRHQVMYLNDREVSSERLKIAFDTLYERDLEMTEFLLERGANVNKAVHYHEAALYLACYKNYVPFVGLFLRHHADVSKAQYYGRDVLSVASEKGHEAVVQLLLTHQKHTYREICKALWIACAKGHVEVVRHFLAGGANVLEVNNKGQTAFSIACENNQEAVITLLNEYVDPHAFLFIACQHGQVPTMRYLIQQGANINQANNDGKTPFWIASENGQLEAVALLLKRHADINQTDNEGKSPFWFACENGHLEVVVFLYEHGADINQADNEGKSPFWFACENAHLEVVERLIDCQADINQADNEGKSPFWAAYNNGHVDVMHHLFNHNVDVDQVETPRSTMKHINSLLEEACEKGYLKIACYLVEKGACFRNDNHILSLVEKFLELKKGESVFTEIERLIGIISEYKPIEKEVSQNEGEEEKEEENEDDASETTLRILEDTITTCENIFYAFSFLTERYELKHRVVSLQDDFYVAYLTERYELKHRVVSLQNDFYVEYLLVASLLPLENKSIINKCIDKIHLPLSEHKAFAICHNFLVSEEDDLVRTFIQRMSNKLLLNPIHVDTFPFRIHKDALENFIDHKVNYRNEEEASYLGDTPLMVACKKGSIRMAMALVKDGADVNQANNFGDTPLKVACEKSHYEMAEFLIDKGAIINTVNSYEETPLLIACKSIDQDIVGLLLRKLSKPNRADNINRANNDGNTPLYLACGNRFLKVVARLINEGANINTQNNYGNTPLLNACSNGCLDVVNYLIESDANLNDANNYKITPIVMAFENHHIDIAILLIAHGADTSELKDEMCDAIKAEASAVVKESESEEEGVCEECDRDALLLDLCVKAKPLLLSKPASSISEGSESKQEATSLSSGLGIFKGQTNVEEGALQQEFCQPR